MFKIEKPNISRIDGEKLFKRIFHDPDIIKLANDTFEPVYLYWDKIKHKNLPKGIMREEFWAIIKIIRKLQSSKTTIKDENGKYFTWLKLPGLEQFLHQIDLNTGGNLPVFAKDIDERDKYKMISRGVMEEAIASSQLEGANTTREVAKELLREGRKPTTKSEQMIFNNYKAMKIIEEEYKNKELTIELMFELHKMITEDTISEKEQGRFRKDEEKIVVSDSFGKVYHIPPKTDFVEKEINAFLDFANDKNEESFLHPVIKAIMLHFWLAYLHPFTDGNGRLARLLFYWYLLKKNYWAFAYLPLSKAIKESPIQYGNAYVYSEQDDLDLTYFIDYNIRKIKIALESFIKYLEKESQKNKEMNKLSRSIYHFNRRQIQLLQYLCDNKKERTSATMHMNIYQISKVTAIKDLKKLKDLGFLLSQKKGRYVYYYPTEKIKELFNL